MRYDMHEVVIERPRSGSRYSYRHLRPQVAEWEDLPDKEGMRRPYVCAGYLKEFSDLLGPLKRFLISCVGRLWNDVYSEIRERISPRSTVQIHICGHIDSMVARYVVERDGELMDHGRYYHKLWPGDLYVNPRNGILCRVPEGPRPWRNRPPKPEADKIVLAYERELHRVDGIWYWAVFGDQPTSWCDSDGAWHSAPGGRYQSGKRQLSRIELRKHGLENRLIV